MIPNTLFNVSSVQTSLLPIQLVQVEGYVIGATARWLQVHDSCTTPASGAVPIYELPVAGTAQFFENLQDDHLNLTEGLFIGLSTAEGTYTASTDKMDITAWTDKTVVSATVIGDKTTGASSLAVWTEATGAAGQKKLYGLIVQNKNAVTPTIYALTYAQIPPADFGNWQSLLVIPANAGGNNFVKASLGDGLTPQSSTLAAGASTLHLGCKVFISDTIPTTGGSLTADANATILAITN